MSNPNFQPVQPNQPINKVFTVDVPLRTTPPTHTSSPPSRRPSQRKQRQTNRRRLIIVSIGIALLVSGVLLYIGNLLLTLQEVETRAQILQNSVNQLTIESFTLQDFVRLKAELTQLDRKLQQATRLIGWATPLVSFHPPSVARLNALNIANDLSNGVSEMANGVEPSLVLLFGAQSNRTLSFERALLERLIERLDEGQASFERAQMSLNRANERMNSALTPSLSLASYRTLRRLQPTLEQVTRANALLLASSSALDEAFGITEPTHYLLLSANNDEIRTSGGFVSTYGWLTVEQGEIRAYDYRKVRYPPFGEDPIAPTLEAAQDFNLPSWWAFTKRLPDHYAAFRNSWYAHFPDTAEMALWYYNTGNNPQAPMDHIIWIDIDGFTYLLDALGEVTVPPYEQPLRAGNFRQLIYDIELNREQNEFLSQAYAIMLAQLPAQSQNEETAPRLLQAVLRALNDRHLMLYSTSPDLQTTFSALGWAGEMLPTNRDDYLLVADSNITGNKYSRSVERRIQYQIELLEDNTLRGDLGIEYAFLESLALEDPAYQPTFLGENRYQVGTQIFQPVGVQLLPNILGTWQIAPLSVENANHVMHIGYQEIAFNTRQQVQLPFTSSVGIQPFAGFKRYRLSIQKQGGKLGELLEVIVTLPPDAQLIEAIPAPQDHIAQTVTFRFEAFNRDRSIEVLYR